MGSGVRTLEKEEGFQFLIKYNNNLKQKWLCSKTGQIQILKKFKRHYLLGQNATCEYLG